MTLVLLELSCLGQFQARVDGFPARFATDHGRALLAYLAVEADRPHSRAYLAFLFWPEHPEAHALNNLRQTLIRLRQALAVDDRSSSLLDITSKTIQFNSAAATLDVRRFQQWLAQCKAHAHHSLEQCAECMQTLEQATTLYKGEFLQGISLRHSQPFTEWAIYVREELHHQMLSVLQTLATYFEEQGDYGRARAFVARQLTLEPWHEEAHYQMMRVLAKGGQRAAAILQYETCKNVLFEELGIVPSSEITLLYERLKADTFARVGDAMSPMGSSLGGQRGLSSIGTPTHSRWGDLPAISRLYGRQSELAQLEKWLIEEQSRLVMVFGMGGIGKTTLTTSAVETTARHYEIVLWRSLVNAPTLNEILSDWLGILSAENLAELPQGLDAQLALLMQHLRQHRCLLILDNLETLFSAEQAGQMRPDYADYEQLFQQVAEMHHQSCLVLTSREQLHSIAHFNDDLPWVRTLWLEGLHADAAQTLLISRDLTVQNSQAAALVGLYSGNPLALKLVAETIQELFDGHVDEFLASSGVIFDDIRAVLEQQFGRLPVLEQKILLWLAIEREPLSFESLRDNVAPTHPAPEIIAALRALQRRSLLQRTIHNQATNGLVASTGFWAETRFTVPNVVTEYLVDRLVQAACQEIEAAKPDWLHIYCLMQAQAKEYVRQTQVRLILQPVASYVEARLGRKGVRRRVMAMLDALRAEPFLPRSYVVGNLLNLLIFLDVDLRGLDLAGFAVWQSDLRHANLANVNLAGADLTRSRFVDAFGFVHTVAVSPDGTRIAAGTNSGEVRLWDAVSGHLLHVYKGHREPVRSIAFRPDGKTLASSSEDHHVRLWSVEVATLPGSPSEARPELSTESSTESSTMIAPMARILDEHTGRVLSVAFHPNGNMLATASSDQTVRLWDVVSGETRAVLTEHEQPVWAVAFSPDGRTLASSDASGAICLWDSQTGELRTTLRGQTMIVRSLAFDPKSRWLASGSHDHTVCLWNVANGEIEHTLAAATDIVTSVAFSPDGALLAVGGDDHIIRLWETNRLTDSLTPVHQLFGHNDAICDLAFSPDGQTLVSGGVDHIVCLWDLHRARIRRILSGYSQHINALAFHLDGKRLASGHYDHCVRVWDVDKRVLMQTLQGHTLSVNSVAFGRDGAFLASGSSDKRIMVWTMPAPLKTSAEAGEIRRRFQLRGHQREVTGVEFSADGKQLLSSSQDQTLGVWDLETGESRYFQIVDEVPIFSVKSNATGTLIATLTDRTIRLWNGEDGELTKELPGHSDFIWSPVFSSDGRWLASGGSDGSIGLWDVRNPAQAHLVTTLHGHAERLFCVAFSPDAKWIASAGADHTVCLWEIESQQKIHTFTGHTQWIFALAFSPDGRLLASGGLDETIRLWDLEQGAQLALLPSPGPYAGMNISGVTGISDAERTILKQLGAVEM